MLRPLFYSVLLLLLTPFATAAFGNLVSVFAKSYLKNMSIYLNIPSREKFVKDIEKIAITTDDVRMAELQNLWKLINTFQRSFNEITDKVNSSVEIFTDDFRRYLSEGYAVLYRSFKIGDGIDWQTTDKDRIAKHIPQVKDVADVRDGSLWNTLDQVTFTVESFLRSNNNLVNIQN